VCTGGFLFSWFRLALGSLSVGFLETVRCELFRFCGFLTGAAPFGAFGFHVERRLVRHRCVQLVVVLVQHLLVVCLYSSLGAKCGCLSALLIVWMPSVEVVLFWGVAVLVAC
jgi:hypothetical protein